MALKVGTFFPQANQQFNTGTYIYSLHSVGISATQTGLKYCGNLNSNNLRRYQVSYLEPEIFDLWNSVVTTAWCQFYVVNSRENTKGKGSLFPDTISRQGLDLYQYIPSTPHNTHNHSPRTGYSINSTISMKSKEN